ncbi:MAG: hypothetical protein K9J30_12145 [Bacteroidales bacterium]|nr:hypothetical protein [Bacteroidales bacterium]
MKTIEEVDQYVVKDIRDLNESTYVLRFNRGIMEFKPGQHVNIGINEKGEHREYSIYSGTHGDYVEVLIKEVDDGLVSRRLRKLKPGDQLSIRGPFGFFLADAKPASNERLLFVASGTGIAPFHSFMRTFPEADYRLIHGIRNIDEAYDKDHYKESRYFSCTSRGNRGDYNGRLTDYLLEAEEEKAEKVYLCGNSSMIYDAMDILRAQGYRHDQIFTEVYF